MSATISTWTSLARSVRGMSHMQSNLPNQDAFLQDSIRLSRILLVGSEHRTDKQKYMKKTFPECEIKVLLLADGHGSKRHFRSERGSKCAVEAGQLAFQNLIFGLYTQNQLNNYVQVEARVPDMLKDLYKIWLHLIGQDIGQEKFTLEQSNLIDGRSEVAYGSTLLGVLVTQDWTLYIQLGDGDILAVDADGTVRQPIPHLPELIANETTSLCQENALSKFQWHLEANTEADPTMLMLSTDGYVNSFREESALLQAGKDFLELKKTQGLDFISQELETWLSEMTREGSGDDITLGLLFRESQPNQDASEPLSLPKERSAAKQLSSGSQSASAEPVQKQSEAAVSDAPVIPEVKSDPEPNNRSLPAPQADTGVSEQAQISESQLTEQAGLESAGLSVIPETEAENKPVPLTQAHTSEEEPIHAST